MADGAVDGAAGSRRQPPWESGWGAQQDGGKVPAVQRKTVAALVFDMKVAGTDPMAGYTQAKASSEGFRRSLRLRGSEYPW